MKTFFFLCPGRGGKEREEQGEERTGREGAKREERKGEGREEVFLFHWNVREGGDSSILFCMLRAWLMLYPQ